MNAGRIEPSTPQDGDVVVTCEGRLRVYYTVRQVPSLVQFSATARDEAVGLARRFGQEHRIDVWYSENGTYRLLETYRPSTPSRPSDRQRAGLPSRT